MIGHKHSRETKDLISRRRKAFLAANPDKVPYLLNHHSKGPSYPERYFKDVFKNEGLEFVEQFRVGLYALDFAVLDRMVDIEVHGNQHYDDPRIVASDERRREKLRRLGWHVIEIRWSHFMSLSKDKKRDYVIDLIAAINARAKVDVPPPITMPISCEECHAEIRKPRRGQTHCGRKCIAATKARTVVRDPIDCGTCGGYIDRPRETQVYCSRKCRDIGTGLQRTKARSHQSVEKVAVRRSRATRKCEMMAPRPIILKQQKVCCNCGGPSDRKFCSTACAGFAARKVVASNEDIVLVLEENDFNYEKTGRHFGCSGNAIKNRAAKIMTLPRKHKKTDYNGGPGGLGCPQPVS